MGVATIFASCCTRGDTKVQSPEESKTVRQVAKGIDLILGIALTALAIYGLLSGSIPQGTSQIMLGAGAVYLGLVLLKILTSVKCTSNKSSAPNSN